MTNPRRQNVFHSYPRYALTLVTGFLCITLGAQAADAGIGRKLLRGITYGLSPTLGELPNGPFADQNVFRQRFIRDIPGGGYGYEFTRIFGTDSYGNAQQIDAGPVNIALQGAIHNRIIVHQRFIPEITFQSDTVGAPLNYNMNLFTGLQNFGLSGAINSQVVGTINAFGFYNLQVLVQNANSGVTADGWLITADEDLDFDIGPIDVVGNIWFDLAANFAQAVGGAPFSSFFNIPSGASARLKLGDIDPASADADELDAAGMQAMIQQAIVQAVLGDLLGNLFPFPIDLSGIIQNGLQSQDMSLHVPPSTSALNVPEPGTLVLLGAPAVLLLSRKFRALGRNQRRGSRRPPA